jgi:hypothetical protein
MAHIDATQLVLHERSGQSIRIGVFDDDGAPVDLTQAQTGFAVVFARNNSPTTPAALQKDLSDGVQVGGENHIAIVEIEPDDYDDGVLKPRMFGHWFTAWYKPPGEEPGVIGEGPVIVRPTIAATFS